MSDLILFDIDGTLFDPEKFGKLIRAEFTKILNINEEDLIRANADYYSKLETSTDFNPRDIVSYISSVFKADRAPLDEVFWGNNQIYKDSFFEDAEDVLKKLSQGHTLGIFSQGNLEFQNRKVDAAGIRKYLSPAHIYIHSRKLLGEVLEKLPQNATIIDNKHDVVTELVDVAEAIWVNRKTEDSDPNIKTIHSLNELLETSQ